MKKNTTKTRKAAKNPITDLKPQRTAKIKGGTLTFRQPLPGEPGYPPKPGKWY